MKDKRFINAAFQEFQYIIKSFLAPIVNGGSLECEGINFYCAFNNYDNVNIQEYISNFNDISIVTGKSICEWLNGKSDYCAILNVPVQSTLWFRVSKKNPPFTIGIKLSNIDSTYPVHLLSAILRELIYTGKYSYSNNGDISFTGSNQYHDNSYTTYKNEIYKIALERGICRSLDNSGYLYTLVVNCRLWAQRTYEGSHRGLCLLYDSKLVDDSGKCTYENINLQQKLYAILASGDNSTLIFNQTGLVSHTELTDCDICTKFEHEIGNVYIPYVTRKDDLRVLFAPNGYEKLASQCDGQKQAVALTTRGDVLIFHYWQVMYCWRNGKWYMNDFYSFSLLVQNIDINDYFIQRLLYGTCLDVSFGYTGGCLAIIHDSIDDAQLCLDLHQSDYFNCVDDSVIEKDDWFPTCLNWSKDDYKNQEKYERLVTLRKIVKNNNFYMLTRKIRQELLGIDGATIIRKNGQILGIGVVVKQSTGSSHGAREAAARKLAQFGLAIKISSDGDVECWAAAKENLGDINKPAKKVYQLGKLQGKL